MFAIQKITCFVATDKDGEEGLIGELLGNQWLPFVCADEERIKSILPRIKEMLLRDPDLKIKILQFDNRTDVTDKYL